MKFCDASASLIWYIVNVVAVTSTIMDPGSTDIDTMPDVSTPRDANVELTTARNSA